MFLTRIARCRSVLFLLHDARFCWRFVLFIRIYVCFPIFAHVICSMYWYLLIDVWRKILCSATKTFQAPGLDWRTSPECRGRWQWLESWSSLDHHTMWYCDTMVVQYVQLRLVKSCCVLCLQNLSAQAVDHREQDRRAIGDPQCMILWCLNGPGAWIELIWIVLSRQSVFSLPLAIEYQIEILILMFLL